MEIMAKREEAAYCHSMYILISYEHDLSPHVLSPLPSKMTFCHPFIMELHTTKRKQIKIPHKDQRDSKTLFKVLPSYTFISLRKLIHSKPI